MKISFGITVHNETQEIDRLLKQLTAFIDTKKNSNMEYEIVILDDYSDNETCELMNTWQRLASPHITIHQRHFDKDFAEHKNFLNEKCSGDWIFQLDADEYLSDLILVTLEEVLTLNSNVDLIVFPRVNVVQGLTQNHIDKWGWSITGLSNLTTTEEVDVNLYEILKKYDLILSKRDTAITYKIPLVCWPDLQGRLYKNSPDIKWKNKVHERLEGFKTITTFPLKPEFSIFHYKHINKQEQQNELYSRL